MKDYLIMIPGTLCDGLLFQHQIKALADLANCTVADHSTADDLKQVALNILECAPGSFSVMGLSYGGIIAYEMWRQAPNRISKMILLNTTCKLPSKETQILQERLAGMALLGKFKEVTSDILKRAMLHPDCAAIPELRQLIMRMALNTGKGNFINQLKSQLGRPDSTSDLPNIKCPVLIITGRQDKVCTPELHMEMAKMIPGSTLEIIEDCGHLSTLEQPVKVNEVILKWWKTVDGRKVAKGQYL